MTLTIDQEALYDLPTHINALVYLHVPTLVFEAPLSAVVTRERATVGLTVGTPTVGALSAVRPEMSVQLDIDGHADGGRQRVRGVSGSTILVGRSGAGRTDGRLDTTRGGTVRVYADYRPYFKAPFISPDSLEQYKDETLYPSDNAAQPPVACAGTDRLIVTEAASATVDLTALDAAFPSFAVRAGATLTSFAWNVGDGTPIGGSLTSSAVQVNFPRGARWISLTVTDSNGVSQTTHRLIVVARRSDCIPARIDSLTLTPDGGTMNLTVEAEYLSDGLPLGAKCLVAEVENHGTPLIGYAERFSGWLTTETATLASARAKRTSVSIAVASIADMLRQMPLFPQSVNIATGAGGWYAMADANLDRLMHYALHWHSNALALCDWRWSGQGNVYPFAAWTTSGASVWADVAALSEAIGHQLTADSRGRLRIVGNPHVLPSAAQASAYGLPTTRPSGVETTLTPDRVTRYTLTAPEPPAAYWMTAEAILASDTAVAVVSCIAPSNAPAFGQNGIQRGNWLVTAQDELNVWAANEWAATHAPPVGDLSISALNAAHIVEPAERRFIGVTLPATVAERYNLFEDDARWTVERVSYAYGGAGGKRADYLLKKEVVASSPALTTRQTIDDSTVQAWAGFDESIVPTTGGITQTFEGAMSMTQAQFEESMKRVRLILALSERDAASDLDFIEGGDGTSDPSGGTNDTANARATGGYFEVALRLNQFWTNAAAFWADVEGLGDAQARFSSYVQTTVTGVTSTVADAWALHIATVSDTFPSLSVTQRADATEQMYCNNGARAGLTQYASANLTGATWTNFIEALKVITDAQFDVWYQVGTSKPLDFYRGYFCALGETDTFTLTQAQINANTTINGLTTQFTRADGSIVRVKVSGRYEDDVRIVDAFFIKVKATGALTYSSMFIGFGAGVELGEMLYSPPTYRADGIYEFNATTATLISGTYSYVVDNRSRPITGTAVGQFDFVITDLGAR